MNRENDRDYFKTLTHIRTGSVEKTREPEGTHFFCLFFIRVV